MTLPPPSSRSVWARYSLALAAMMAAVLLRWALIPILGLNIPYLTVFPAMMIVAVTLGAGPGVVATVVGLLLAEYYFLPPAGPIWSLSLAIRAVILLLTSLYVGRLAQTLRATRAQAEADAAAARTAEAALRRQVELIDPARAEVIRQEMQRVVRARASQGPVPAGQAGQGLPRCPTLAGGGVAAVGVLVLVGWLFGVGPLKSILPGLTTMKANTALCFILVGLGLVWRERPAWRWGGAAVVAVIAALSLAEYLLAKDFGLDQLFFHDPGDPRTVPGRMAPSTALAFLASSGALVLLAWRGRVSRWAQQALAVATGVVGLAAVLGYAYQVQPLYTVVGRSSMALPTAAALAVLGAGLLCARADGLAGVWLTPGPGAQLAGRLLPAALVVPVLLGWLHVMGERVGVFERPMGAGLFALAMVLSLAVMIGWTALTLNRTDAIRREAETQLRSQAEVIDHAREALIVRETGGAIRSWNRGAETLYGWPAAEALGQRTHFLLHTAGVPVQDLDRQLQETGYWEGELIHTTRDGRRVTVESRQTATRSPDGGLLILESNRDITARRQAEEALRQAHDQLERRVLERTAELRQTMGALAAGRRRFQDVLDQLPAYLVLISPDYQVPFANRFFEQRFGEAKGRRCFEYLFQRTTPCDHCESFKVLDTHAPHHWQWTGPDHRHYDIHDFPFTDTDGSPLIMEVGLDITERRQAEAEVEQYRQHLEELVRQRTAQLETANSQLQREIGERAQAEAEVRRQAEELRATNAELVLFNRAMVDRELRMIELKQEVNELCARTGLAPRYQNDPEGLSK